ncbi:MAG: NAD-dependent DNA ligase LigA [Spirochaetales bacterium]|nr:NAD-dependent DNA ligase LigA [Spirochaetales bacterium]
MTTDEAKKEIDEMSRLLRRYQYEYYVLSRPSVSDAEYDRLFDRLVSLEKEYPALAAIDSPSLRVGSDLSADFPEVRHAIPVLSLDKATTHAQVLEWMQKLQGQTQDPISFVCEQKIDGASIVLTYERGILARAVTRGNGEVGNDVTSNVKTIMSVPLSLPRPVDVTVRGEIFLPRELFDKINEGEVTPYANPRNLASGTLRRVKSSEVARVPLDIFVYEGFFRKPPATHLEIIEELVRLEFKVNPRLGYFSPSGDFESERTLLPQTVAGRPEDVPAFIEKTTRERDSLPYEIDGLVFKVNEIGERDKLGYTGHHPRWAVAYKFDAPHGVAKVLAVDVQVGRTGRITPVARISPVVIAGSTVSNVTLHNQEYIDLLELAVGDSVAVSKRGDVIPAVERVLEKNEEGYKTWLLPAECPGCGSPLEKIGAHYFCRNPECEEKLRGELRFFCARDQMDIENLGGETLDALFENKIVRYVEDIYAFDVDALLDLPGFGEKKVALIRDGIEKSKAKPFRTVLSSLGVPELGKKAAELLVNGGYTDIDRIIDLADKKDPAPLLEIKGIGEKLAAQIIDAFADKKMRRRIAALKKHGLRFAAAPDERRPELPAVFRDQVWCVTGSFESFKPRDLAMEEVKKRGGTVVSSVSSKTTHLLAGEGAGSKLEKAKHLGVKVVSEKEFLALM